MEPRILYHHPLLDRKFGLPADYPVLTDDEVAQVVDRFVSAAQIAEQCGAAFVDIKHCHGYLGHEFLSAHTRPGRYGGSFENRTRFLREVVEGIRATTRKLKSGVRLSAFDLIPYPPGAHSLPYNFAFGADREHPENYDLTEPAQFLELLGKLGIRMVNLTAGSPYYNPHIQRPALFPPSDGYQPPEDPLVGCARQIEVTAALKRRVPEMVMVGTAYTYFQEYLPHIAQWAVRSGHVDAVGLGRMVLSYPTLPRDVLGSGKLDARRLCRTFSDCTTAPRNGLVSGCFPLDPFYKTLPEASQLKRIKAR